MTFRAIITRLDNMSSLNTFYHLNPSTYKNILIMDPALCSKYLFLQPKDLSSVEAVRKAFKERLLKPSVFEDARCRINLNLAYSHTCARIYKSQVTDFEEMVIYADLEGIKKKIQAKKSILNEKINQYPPVYLAVRCGHYEVVQFFLKAGCRLDFKGDRSTPMHCAAYYGHVHIIPLLFMYGIPTDIKNVFDHVPAEEASTEDIKKLLNSAKLNQIYILHDKLLNSDLSLGAINIKDRQGGEVVMKKLIHKNYRQYWNHAEYDNAFHGTHIDNLFSIMKHGLKRPGDIVEGKSLEVVDGHIPLGTTVRGEKDWPKAIFLSPSIYYSSHPVYSKEFIDNGTEVWLPLLQVKVKKGSYTRHDHTLGAYNVKSSQPTNLELRVVCPEDPDNLIIRSEKVESVVIIAVLLVKKGFLDENEDYKTVSKCVLDSPEEIQFKKYL